MTTLLDLPRRQEPTYYYRNLEPIQEVDGVWDVNERLPEVITHGEFKTGDRVLDIGCAEGLIALEVARHVRHVRGVEIRKKRVAAAAVMAEQAGIENVSFETGSVVDTPIGHRSYDVILFLGVFQHLNRQHKWASLEKVLLAARRSVLFRTPIFHEKSPYRINKITRMCQALDYSLTIYPRREERGGSFMVMKRMVD